MDVLNNLSCCFDASKDIGETSVELFICNCALSKKCCLRWETITYVAALIFSTADFLADVFGYISFVNVVEDKAIIQNYTNTWLAFLIISGLIIVSEIALPVYSLCKVVACCASSNDHEQHLDGYRLTAKYWSRVNNISVILTEDGIVAMVRILIAFRSPEAISDLQTTTGAVSSAIAFCVTILRHCLLILQIATKLSSNGVTFSKCPAWEPGYCTKSTFGLLLLFFFTLFLSSCALGLTGMSMAISVNLFEIHFDDEVDFLFNITLLAVAVPLTFLFSVFVIILTRW